MPETTRTRIFERLHAALTDRPEAASQVTEHTPQFSRNEKIDRLTELMTGMRAEVIRVAYDQWTDTLNDLSRTKKFDSLLYGPDTTLADELTNARQKGVLKDIHLSAYGERVETFKDELFRIDAGITTTKGAIADRGALILWPTPREPRLISLVPPVHIAVVDADRIYGTMEEAIFDLQWQKELPTNVVLVSGPSKTADIEFTLVFGVHGPKELVVILREE